MDNTESIPKKARKRSASYPAYSLEEVIDATKNLKEKLGDGPYSREHMAVALGYKGVTGSSGMKIASCVHFGLLERNGNTYSQSELANRFFNYLDEQERTQILLEAFGKPALYQKLITEYSGKSLPQMLESIFVRNYGIQENAARGAVANFKESAEFVDALKNGVLSVEAGNHTSPESQSPPFNPIEGATTDATVPARNTNRSFVASANNEHLSVTLPSGLVVSYSHELASAFAFGIFGQKLMELDEAIAEYKKSLNIANNTTDTSVEEE